LITYVYADEEQSTTILLNDDYEFIALRIDDGILGLFEWSSKSFAIVNTSRQSTPLLYPTITEHDAHFGLVDLTPSHGAQALSSPIAMDC
jgi:hypothetical protein